MTKSPGAGIQLKSTRIPLVRIPESYSFIPFNSRGLYPQSTMATLGRGRSVRLLTTAWLVCVLLHSSVFQEQANALKVGFYDSTCADAESTVKSAVQSAHSSDQTITASLIRLQFHDCFVDGCDASVLLTGTGTEQTAQPNQSLRGFSVINNAKATLEGICPGVVSCADIIVLAARDSVGILGGPTYEAETGRFDGTAPGTVNLPSPDNTVAEATAFFTNVGLTQTDMVNLLGAHTVGVSQCQLFVDRLYNFNSTGSPDPSLDKTYLATLQSLCPDTTGDTTNVALDDGSEFSFDTSYFNNIEKNKGLLSIDQEIGNDASTSGMVKLLGASASTFSQSFVTSMIRLGNIGVLTSGKVRSDCTIAN